MARPWQDILVLFAFVGLTLIMTYPLIMHLGTALLGPPGDNFEYLYKVWWFTHALKERVSPFFIPDVFYPFGYRIIMSETTLSNIAPAVLVTLLCDQIGSGLWSYPEVIGYNATLLLSFMLSGYTMYLLVRYVTGKWWAGLVSGVIFAFCPYRMAHLGAGHLPLMGTQWLPALFLCVEKWVRERRLKYAAWAGVFYALTALSSWYYAYMVGGALVLYLLLRVRWVTRRGNTASSDKVTCRGAVEQASSWWQAGLCFGGIVLILLAPVALPLVRLSREGETMHKVLSLAYIDQWSASPLDFFYPNIMHPLWGKGLLSHYRQNVQENLLYLGIIPLILAGIGARHALQREGLELSRLARAFLWLGIVTFVLALGTTLHWNGKPVYLRVPDSLAHFFSRGMYALTGKWALNRVSYATMERAGHILVPLPTLLLYLFLPLFNAMRTWGRFGLLTLFSVAVLAGFGVAKIRRHRVGTLLCGAITLLILFDFATLPYAFGWSLVRPQPVDEWLAAQKGDFAVIQYPLDRSWYGDQLYRAVTHGKKIAYGYGTFLPRAYREAEDVLRRFPDLESMGLLRDWNVRYVLVSASWYGAEWGEMARKLAATPGLRHVLTIRDEPIYEGDRLLRWVPASRAVPVTEVVDGQPKAYLVDTIHVYEIIDQSH